MRLIKKYFKENITKIRNKNQDITIDHSDIKSLKENFIITLITWVKWTLFLEKLNSTKLITEEIQNLK